MHINKLQRNALMYVICYLPVSLRKKAIPYELFIKILICTDAALLYSEIVQMVPTKISTNKEFKSNFIIRLYRSFHDVIS